MSYTAIDSPEILFKDPFESHRTNTPPVFKSNNPFRDSSSTLESPNLSDASVTSSAKQRPFSSVIHSPCLKNPFESVECESVFFDSETELSDDDEDDYNDSLPVGGCIYSLDGSAGEDDFDYHRWIKRTTLEQQTPKSSSNSKKLSLFRRNKAPETVAEKKEKMYASQGSPYRHFRATMYSAKGSVSNATGPILSKSRSFGNLVSNKFKSIRTK